jgi:quinol monooxygenase YgiN
MKQQHFPPGWDEESVIKVLLHYEEQTEDEAVAEDEAAFQHLLPGSAWLPGCLRAAPGEDDEVEAEPFELSVR